jgi:aryl-phospho-beta-D-glucosidase BglC (GH1 family)
MVIIAVAVAIEFSMAGCTGAKKPNLSTSLSFLKADGRDLRDNYGQGNIVNLRGTNIGGFLLQEFWMTPTNHSDKANAEIDIFKVLTERFGGKTMYELVDLYQKNYFTEKDFDNLAEIGINCARLPFWDRNLTDEKGNFYGYSPWARDPYTKAFERIDWFIEEAGKRNIYVILDFHGAPGSQNGSDHSGRDGGKNKEARSEFFFGTNARANQNLFYRIWEVIASRYKGNPAVAGYDLLNEPFCTWRYTTRLSATQLNERLLWPIYDQAYQKIRAVDPDHVIIMGATWDPVDLPDPQKYGWSNVMYEYHNYGFDFEKDINGLIANMNAKLGLIKSAGYNVPSYMGEFSYFGIIDAWDQGLAMFNELGINWTSWTYKTTPNMGNWGLYHHPTNRRVNVETASEDVIRETWQAVNVSVPNKNLINVISKHLKTSYSTNNMILNQ